MQLCILCNRRNSQVNSLTSNYIEKYIEKKNIGPHCNIPVEI